MCARLLLATSAAGAALVSLTVGPLSDSAVAARACTASDLQGSRAPAMLNSEGLDTQDSPLIAGTRYTVVVVQELAIGDNDNPVDGSVSVGAPSGPPLQPTTQDDRPAYAFTPTGAGTQRLVVSWQDEVGSPGSGDICTASQSFDLPVVAPNPARTHGRFIRGGTFGSSFTMKLSAKAPQVSGKVTVLLRARRGTTRPPAPRGHALAHFTLKPTGDGHFSVREVTRHLRKTFFADTIEDGVRIYPEPNIPFHRTLRFAFSFEAIQNGHRVGGMRSGASCRRIQFTGHSAVKCHPVGLRQRP